MNNINEFKDLKYGMMIHFGIYSMLHGEYHSKKSFKYAEWITSAFQIKNKEMEQLASIFNPIYFDSDLICEKAISYGFKYIIITTKHHDGFALFNSKYDNFNIYHYQGRDLIQELANSCKKYKLKLGFYYSQDLDWHEENGGGYKTLNKGMAGVSWSNTWDFPSTNKDFNKYFYTKVFTQVKELCTNYKDIFLFFFDMPLTLSEADSEALYNLVKEYQPNCLINSRLGSGKYDYVTLGDNEIPDKIDTSYSKMNDIDGFKPSPNGLYESIQTLNDSWGYNSWNNNYKSAKDIATTRLKLEKLNINYVVNISPDNLGQIPAIQDEILTSANKLYLEMKKETIMA